MDILILAVILLLASSAASSKPESPTPSSADSNPTTDPPISDEYRLLYIKNVKPYVLSDHHSPLPPSPFHRLHRHRHHGRHRGDRRKQTKSAAGRSTAHAVKQPTVDAWPNRRSTSGHAVGPGPRPRPFYVMLPKGYVPPSGSSPCHNLYPTTTADDDRRFDCHFFPNHLLKP